MATLKTDDRNKLDKKAFAFPDERKEPLENAAHVRNAIARFNQVKGVGDADRDAAWKRIKAAAKKYDVEVSEQSWREIGKDSERTSVYAPISVIHQMSASDQLRTDRFAGMLPTWSSLAPASAPNSRKPPSWARK